MTFNLESVFCHFWMHSDLTTCVEPVGRQLTLQVKGNIML